MPRSIPSRRNLILLGCLAAAAALFFRPAPAVRADKSGPDAEALARTRETVRMLDDLYKGFVVHITDTYVKAQETTPAARVAKRVFKHMEEKGWHSGRLVDTTGEPINRANLPRNDFERRAVEQLRAGKTYYEEVGSKDGKPVLRAATAVPVVMKQCLACHPGYKEGDLIGSLVYEVPIR